MVPNGKILSNPFSTGGGGHHFEAQVQAFYVTLMFTGGYAPGLPTWPIKAIKLQGKIDGYNTDDLIIFVENNQTGEKRKLLGQIKHFISFTNNNSTLEEVLRDAWLDFNDEDFQKDKDIIAFITGPLNGLDQKLIQRLLHHARQIHDATEFHRNIQQTNFSSNNLRKKLAALRSQLNKIVGNSGVSDEELHKFLKHLHLFVYDLGETTGITLSLLYSHMSQFALTNPQMIFSRIIDMVQTKNHHAGTILSSNLPDDLCQEFPRKLTSNQIPEALRAPLIANEINWNEFPHRNELCLMALIGSWDEKNQNDIAELSALLKMPYEKWLPKAQIIFTQPNSPLKIKNGIWTVHNKEKLLNNLGFQVLDFHLDQFRIISTTILQELDPALELAKEERYAASLYGKKQKYSENLRQGITEGLAISSNNPIFFKNCSSNKPEIVATNLIHQLFAETSWQQWATLNNVLPNLAESAPNEFLKLLDNLLLKNSQVFKDIFTEESSGITGNNYFIGLLWALERLVWNKEYFIRGCCILAKLAALDPGGNSANRPINSLITILLPWLPQTLAPFDKRKTAITTILSEIPEIGWKVLIELLPNKNQTSVGTQKPRWHKKICAEKDKSISNQEFWQHASFCADLSVKLIGRDISRILELINHFTRLTPEALNSFIEKLSSPEMQTLPTTHKHLIWDKLIYCVRMHRRYTDASWVFPNESLFLIEQVAELFAPTDLFNLYIHLFSNNNFDLYEKNGDWEQQTKKLSSRRHKALQKLLDECGIQKVIEFASVVKLSREVGNILGKIANDSIDAKLLPNFLTINEPKIIEFISTYIKSRYLECGWKWVDKFPTHTWTKIQIGQFLSYLPFGQETWTRVTTWLNENENEYWYRAPIDNYQNGDNTSYAINKLLQFNRPKSAIYYLGLLKFRKQKINNDQCIRALLDAINSKEPENPLDSYNIVQLIKYLQLDPSTNKRGLSNVEWAYLQVLYSENSTIPVLLENTLAQDPRFFCELIQLMYRSTNEKKKNPDLSKTQQKMAQNAWHLFYHWRTLPGIENGQFDTIQFEKWIDFVKKESQKSGHFGVAMEHIGKVLIYAPKDKSGLWIHRTIAKALNSEDAENIRSGYKIGVINARGVHWVDQTGKQEKQLAQQFYEKADQIEDEGFRRFSELLREIAKDYEYQVQEVIENFSPN